MNHTHCNKINDNLTASEQPTLKLEGAQRVHIRQVNFFTAFM